MASVNTTYKPFTSKQQSLNNGKDSNINTQIQNGKKKRRRRRNKKSKNRKMNISSNNSHQNISNNDSNNDDEKYDHLKEKMKLKTKEENSAEYFLNIPVTKLTSYNDQLPNVTNKCLLYAAGYCKFGDKCPCLQISKSAHNAKVLLKKENDWINYKGNPCNYPILNNRNNNNKWYKPQLYNYLAVLDLEGLPEIMEFPVLLIDLNTMKEVGRFHNYVIPQQWVKHKLFESKEQNDVYFNKHSNAIAFGDVLSNFDKWLRDKNVFKDYGNNKKNVLFGICGNWDICKQIPLQCYRCGIGDNFPLYMYEWMNIKDFGLNFYKDVKPFNMKGMKSILNYLKIPLKGTHHSGMDDVSNITKIIVRYIKDGAILIDTARRNPKDINQIQFRYGNEKRIGWGGNKM